ncbi:hypothetical protein [Streptomyces sp. NPDC047315]|uniref:hypothetical protein n=1 Tax=Streptomyces sp. NPDC047315 TaxID=3155142 RepID=UPI0034114F1E
MSSVAGDVRLALTTAQALPETHEALRDRLRAHIGVVAGPAEAYAESLTDEWHQRVVLHSVESARKAAVGVDPQIPPGEELMILAEHIRTLLLYASRAPRP